MIHRFVSSNSIASTKITQISNSEHGMSLWNNWYKAFEIEKLYSNLEKEYEAVIHTKTELSYFSQI